LTTEELKALLSEEEDEEALLSEEEDEEALRDIVYSVLIFLDMYPDQTT
jgi:hypothetical protein